MYNIKCEQIPTVNKFKYSSANKFIDKYKRKIDYFRISVTDRCNLRCFYCMDHERSRFSLRKDLLHYEEIIQVVKLAVQNGVSKIRITGGEPLVRNGIVRFITTLAQIPGINDLSLTTNGILLKDFSEKLYIAGLKRVNVSMDSLDHDKYAYITGGGNLRKVWEGVDEAESIGFSPIKINVVSMRGINDDEVLDFAKITLDRPFSVRFIEVMPTGGHNFWRKSRHIPVSEIKERIERIYELFPLSGTDSNGPAREFQIRGAPGKIGFISPLSNHFCSSCNRLRLTADGHLRTCLFSDEEVDLKTHLRKGAYNDAILSLLKYAIDHKPERHKLGDSYNSNLKRGMFAIGG